ncbi:MAG: hypothetical protein KatS3mg055_1045 [Chloroflexus sp.]|nr:MAG: hypothetical protein KatS3mg055_1045 [Chloroflexus sp.]
MPIQAKLVEIGQNQVGEGIQIALELFRSLNLIEFCPRRFGFDIADNLIRAIPDAEIGIAGFSPLGEDGNLDGTPLSRANRFEQRLERGVITLLANIAALRQGGNLLKIGCE